MSTQPLLPDPALLTLDGISVQGEVIVFALRTVAPDAHCPLCGHPSQRIHSRYLRTLADLPWQGIPVRFHLVARKFFCDNPACQRRIFAEPLASVARRYAHKTCRLADALQELAYWLGGEAGAKAARRLGLLRASPDTLLRQLRRSAQPGASSLRIVGVDDFAFCKGRRYGTILVDLERHCPVDLLSDREAQSLTDWLQAHPGVQVVSRDRAQAYAEGARKGAPEAIQVADRWHLLHNLKAALEEFLMRHPNQLRRTSTETSVQTNSQTNASSCNSMPSPPSCAPARCAPCPLSGHEAVRLARRDKRQKRYEQVVSLRAQGKSVPEIAETVGVSKRTVSRFLAVGSFPERRRRRRSPSALDAFLPYLKERFEAGCHKGMQLWREIVAQGYQGPVASIYPVLARLRQGLPLLPSDPPTATGPPTKARYSVREAAWLLWRQPADLETKERGDLEEMLRSCPALATAYALSQEFQGIVRQRQLPALEGWLEAAATSRVGEFRRFAAGVRQDRAAVDAALSLCWSNGQVEGQVNRLKMLKRQMYGRAGLDLLRARVLPLRSA